MKKSFKFLISAMAVILAVALTAGCTNGAAVAAKEKTNTYVTENGMLSVELPGEWEKSDNMGMPNFLILSGKDGSEAIIFGMQKGQLFGPTGADVDNLEGFFDYVQSTFFNSPAIKTVLTETESIEFSGTFNTISKEGTASQTDGASSQIFIECAETEGCYYCFSFSFPENYDKKIVSIKENIRFVEMVQPAAEGLSDTLRWFNSSYAISIKLNGGDLSKVAGFEPAAVKELMRGMLTRDWEVNDQTSLYETIDWLVNEGHNQNALQYLESTGINAASREELLAALEEDGTLEEEVIQILAVYDARAAFGERAVSGWDYVRAMSMLGWGYLADYLTYEEAMDKSLEIAHVIQQNFDSWDDYMSSYFYGYSYWSGESLEDASSNASKRYQIYKELKEQDKGIYSVDFKTDLQKEWQE